MQKRYYLPLTLVLLAGLLACINCEVEICTDGGEHVYQITNETCPFGVLFSQPQSADCLVYTGEDETGILADVCTKEAYSPERKQFQYIPEISSDAIEPGNSCKTVMSTMCNKATQQLHKDSFMRKVTKANLTFEPEKNDSNIEAVREQTQRMFEYTMGLGKVDIDESTRIVLLLKKSFEIMKKFCSNKFVPTGFIEDVEMSFLFLMNEADSTNLKDISYEDYERIMEHLVYCMDQKNPFKYDGKKCATYSMIQRVNKSGQVFSDFDTSHQDAFMKYDLPVEATWGAIDFVHGLCYGTFRDHINSHHLYQQALERLFSKEILFRWKHRLVFEGQQHIWNNFFSANVKLALTNMDLCVQASYLSTPFLHRLERPIDGMMGGPGSDNAAPGTGDAPAGNKVTPNPNPPAAAPPPPADAPPPPPDTKPKERKKRWVETHSLTSLSEVEGYCFQTKEDADAKLNAAC